MLLRSIKAVIVATLVFLSTLPAARAAGGEAYEDHACAEVASSFLAYLSANHNLALRQRIAHDLVYYIRDHCRCWTPSVADKVVTLLADQDTVVRSFAADALWFMGPAAKSAVPALEKALEEADQEMREEIRNGQLFYNKSLGQHLRATLKRITGTAPPELDP